MSSAKYQGNGRVNCMSWRGKVNQLVVGMADEAARSLCVWEGRMMMEVGCVG